MELHENNATSSTHLTALTASDHDIDIIGLSETRLDETISDSEVSISGYKIFRNDRDVNGGGVAIYVKASLLEPTVKIKSKNLELISLEIAPQHAKPFLVVCWYRPPTADDAFENLREVLKNLDRDAKKLSLLGIQTAISKVTKAQMQIS